MTTAAIFDTETHDKDAPQIIEAAILPLKFGNPTTIDQEGEMWCLRFKPSKPITLGAMATHGIMEEDLEDCEDSALFQLPEMDYLIGHAVDFDWVAAGSPPGPKRIDTCALARLLWPNLDCYSQSALIYHLDRANARERLKAAHGAAADVLLCKTILDAEIALMNRLHENLIVDWESLWRESEQARIPTHLTFGKHKGMAIKDAPKDYLAWLLRANDPPIDPYLRQAITGKKPEDQLL